MIVAELFAKLGLIADKSTWSHGDKILDSMKEKVTGLAAGFLAFQAGSGIVGMIEDVVELGGKFNDLEAQTGVAAETLQEWDYIAGLAGASGDEVVNAIGRLNRGLGVAAQTGKGPAADAFRSLGLSLSDAAVKSGNIDEVLLNVANKFANMPDGPKKVAAAMDLFGKSGARLIPTLNQGAAGIEKLKAEARELGVVLDADEISSLDDLGDDIDRVKAAATGLRNEAVTALVPVLRELVTALLDWVRANRELLRNTLRSIIEGAVEVARGLARAIMFVVENWEYAKYVVIAFGLIVAAIIAKIIAGWAVAAIALAPLILVLGVVAAIVYDLWMAFTEGKGVIATVIKWAVDKFTYLVNRVKSAVTSVGNFFKGIGESVFGFFEGIWRKITDFFDEVVDTAKRGANEVIKVLNKLPGVNLDTFETKGSKGGSGPTASVDPTRSPGGSVNSNSVAMGDINITTTTGDPVAIGSEVRRQVRAEMTDQLRHAMADVGGEVA